MIFTTRAFETFVRETFADAQAEMDEAMRQIIAEQSRTSLESGQTVKRFSRELNRIGRAAVVRCRDAAGRSGKRRAVLDVGLPQEVAKLAQRVNARAQSIGLNDSAVQLRFISDRDSILRDLNPPLPPPSQFWPKVMKLLVPTAREIVVGVIIVVIGAVVLIRMGLEAMPG